MGGVVAEGRQLTNDPNQNSGPCCTVRPGGVRCLWVQLHTTPVKQSQMGCRVEQQCTFLNGWVVELLGAL